MLRKMTPVSMDNVRFTGGLLKERIEKNASVTAPLMYQRCLETGRIGVLRHWKWDGNPETEPHPFWDSDIGKMIESAAYALRQRPNAELEKRIDQVIERLEALQLPDGYLNSYFQAAVPEEGRFQNLYYMHELYCAGHLIEGAVAWYEATGKRKFLDIMIRYADLLEDIFSDSGRGMPGYAGHPEIELALVRLFRVTGEKKYLNLARTFLDRRGQEPYFFEQESLKRGVDTTRTANQKRHLKFFLEREGPYAEYQAHKPVRLQRAPVGHAVRAMYLYSGMAEVADCCEDEGLLEACRALWDSVIHTQYAITGGIGAASDGERFTFAYDLPNEHTYNESCASVALVQWADRMLQMEGDAQYADIIEQTLYNVVLGSVSHDGERFFYANYLSVYPRWYQNASKALNDKMQAERQPWFQVSCCPPNICRLIGSLGGRMASVSERQLWIHQYAACRIEASMGGRSICLDMDTDYPWDGRVQMRIRTEQAQEGTLALRIPGWCRTYRLTVNQESSKAKMEKGYVHLTRIWETGDTVRLELEMPVTLMQAHPKVREDCGKVAVMRGPVVYCVEGEDNGEEISNLSIDPGKEIKYSAGMLTVQPEAVCIELAGYRLKGNEEKRLYRPADFRREPAVIRAIPYFLRGNRGFTEMQVWLRYERA